MMISNRQADLLDRLKPVPLKIGDRVRFSDAFIMDRDNYRKYIGIITEDIDRMPPAWQIHWDNDIPCGHSGENKTDIVRAK